MTPLRRLPIFLLLALTAACSPTVVRSVWELRMPLPPTLKGEGIEVTDVESSRLVTGERADIGEARLTGFAREGWDVSRSDGIVHAETNYSFRTAEGSDGWRCDCVVVREHNYFDADAESADRLDEWIDCTFLHEPEAEVWTLTLVTTIRPRMSGANIVSEGELSDGERRFDVTSRYDVEGLRLRPLVPTGYLFADDNEWIAAAETSFAGKFHIRSDVEPRERRAIIVASTALLLRQSLGTLD